MSGLRVCGALRLAARAAAARFASRRERARGPRDVWRPVALRWRSRRRRLETVRSRSAASSPMTVWLHNFHLHFSACVRERIGRVASPGWPAATVIHDARRNVLNRSWMNVRAATLVMRQRRDLSPQIQASGATAPGGARWNVLNQRWTSVRSATLVTRQWRDRAPQAQTGKTAAPRVRPAAPAPARSYRPAPVLSIAPRAAARPRYPLFERTREGVRAGMPKDERAPFATHPRILRSEPQVFRRPPLASRQALPRSPESPPSPARPVRPPDLVWRAAPQSPAGSHGEGLRPDLSASSQRSPARVFPAPETAPEAPPRSGRPAAPQVMNLDSGMLDRLADDVIRRVEKRARIERERRGL